MTDISFSETKPDQKLVHKVANSCDKLAREMCLEFLKRQIDQCAHS